MVATPALAIASGQAQNTAWRWVRAGVFLLPDTQPAGAIGTGNWYDFPQGELEVAALLGDYVAANSPARYSTGIEKYAHLSRVATALREQKAWAEPRWLLIQGEAIIAATTDQLLPTIRATWDRGPVTVVPTSLPAHRWCAECELPISRRDWDSRHSATGPDDEPTDRPFTHAACCRRECK